MTIDNLFDWNRIFEFPEYEIQTTSAMNHHLGQTYQFESVAMLVMDCVTDDYEHVPLLGGIPAILVLNYSAIKVVTEKSDQDRDWAHAIDL